MAEPKYVGVNIEPMPDGYLLQKQENGVVGIDPASVGSDTAANIGSSGEGVFKEKVEGELRFKKLKGSAGITITATETDELEIASTTGGDAVSNATNVGTAGEGVFKEKLGADLRFKKLKGGSGITVTPTETDELEITATGGGGGGEVNTASNIGTDGEGIFKDKSGADLRFKKLKAGTNITITATGSDELEITAAAGGGGSSTGSNLYLHQIYR